MGVLAGVATGWLLGVFTGFMAAKFFSFMGQLKIRDEEVDRRARNRANTLEVMKNTNFKKRVEVAK